MTKLTTKLTPRDEIPEGYIPVTISSDKRIFFGYIHPNNIHVNEGVVYVTDIRRSRNALQWGQCGGAGGLATMGPGEGCQLEVMSDMAIMAHVFIIRPIQSQEALDRWENLPSVEHKHE